MSQYVSRAVLWLTAVAGFGLWLSFELHRILPRSREAVGLSGWCWIWADDTPSVLSVFVYGSVFANLIVWLCVGLRRLWRHESDLPVLYFDRTVALPGVFLLVLSGVCYALQYVTTSYQWGVMMWASMLLSGRLAAFSAVWRGLSLGEMSRNLSPFLARRANILIVLFAVGFSVLLYTNYYTELFGDEPSFAYGTAMMMEKGKLVPTPEEAAHCADVFDQSGEYHRLVHPETQADVPWHFVGPSFALIPIWPFVRHWGFDLGHTVRFYMLGFYVLWAVGAFVLARRLTRHPSAAFVGTVVAAVSFPMIGLSGCVYPDNLAGYILLAALLCCGSDVFTVPGARLSIRRFAAILFLASLLPWLHAKYGFLSVVLGGFALFYCPRRVALRDLTVALLPVGVVAAVFVVYYYMVYGFFLPTPYVEIGGSQNTGKFGVFFDTDSGALVYAPWWLLLPAGLVALRTLTGKWTYSVLWSLLFAVMYGFSINVQFWGSPGSPVIRYFTPVMALSPPLLAAVIVRLRNRTFLPVALFCLPVILLPAYIGDMFTVYGPAIQKGRALWDVALTSFSIQEFFPFYSFSWRLLHIPNLAWHSVALTAIFGGTALILALRRASASLQLGTVMLLPFALGATACLMQSPVYQMNASKIFAAQTAAMRELELRNPLRLRELLGASPGTLHDTTRTVLLLPMAIKPVEDEISRDLMQDDNGLRLRSSRPSGGFANIRTLPPLPPGKYAVALEGRINTADECYSTGIVRLRATYGKTENNAGLFTNMPVPKKREANSSTTVCLVGGTFDVLPDPKIGNDEARIHFTFSTLGSPTVIADRLRLEYLGERE